MMAAQAALVRFKEKTLWALKLLKKGLNLLRADTPTNIQAMLNSDNPDLNEAGKIEARLRRKDAENKEKVRNIVPSIIHKIKGGKALKDISENFNELPKSRKDSIANKSLRLAECDKKIEIIINSSICR